MRTKLLEYLDLYNESLADLVEIASKITKTNFANKMDFCSLISAKTGKCSQNCKYCAQSSHYRTSIETHPLVSVDEVRKSAQSAKKAGASRFAIVTSGRLPNDQELPIMAEMIEAIENEGLRSCASLGIMKKDQMQTLKDAGMKRYHHNINTCKSYHDEVCTTHSYQDRIDTVNLARDLGLEVCCGVILGMGETRQQRIEMAVEMEAIAPESAPINLLDPIPGTPFESFQNKIDEEEILKTLAIFRIIMPNISLRYAGGRIKRLSYEGQKKGIIAGMDSILIGNLLTTIGATPEDDLKMIKECDKELVK